MKSPILVMLFLVSALTLRAVDQNPKLKDCPEQILSLLRSDIRRSFLNITFSANTQASEDAQLDAILATAFGGAHLTCDHDDSDNEFHVTISHGVGGNRKTMSYVYNQTEDGWELVAALVGAFPVGSPAKHDGWRDLSTREPIQGRPNAQRVRTYRYQNGSYELLTESVDSGG